MKKLLKKINGMHLLCFLLAFGVLIYNYIPGIYALPSVVETEDATDYETFATEEPETEEGTDPETGTENGTEGGDNQGENEDNGGEDEETGPTKTAPSGYIFFDLTAGGVTIASGTYTGYIFTTTDGSTTKTTITGTHVNDNKYYVYQSNTENKAITGNVDGVMYLPNYTAVEYDGKSWAEFITNNTDVEGVIDAWNAAAGEREGTANYITVSAEGKTVDLTIEDIWSTFNKHGTGRTTGGIAVTGAGTGNTHVTVRILGDNRLHNVFYYSTKAKTSSLTFTSGKGDGSEDGTLTVIGKQEEKYRYSYDSHYKVKVAPNFWTSVIGGNDGGQGNVYNMYFKGATVYAGSTPIDNCTAIGGGGNDMGNVIIDGGAITAVAHTTGTAIGGGIAHTSTGGTSDVHINGGRVYAYNFGQPAYETVSNFGSAPAEVIREARHIAGTAIGGGSSIMSQGNSETAKVTITGGEVYAESLGGCAIGGGNSVNMTAGSAEINISGGSVIAKSSGKQNYCKYENEDTYYHVYPSVAIGGGRGGIKGDGGSADVNISGNATVTTGSVGGGGTIKPDGKIGYAKVNISGGTTSGQFVMAAGASTACSFTMTGGVISESHADDETYVRMHQNGGAVYMNDPNGVASVSGGTIKNCSAEKGGAVYMTGGTFSISGSASISDCRAQLDGGAICIGDPEVTSETKPTFTMTGGGISRNATQGNGGGIALFGGEVAISGGEISTNTTSLSGGGVYVSGGNVAFSGGSILRNTAYINGGGIDVRNGSVIMSGGSADNNTAGGDGGGIYVSSDGTADVAADILSGSVSGNTAAAHGGAVAVVGNHEGSESISVMIGVNEDHFETMPFEHTHKNILYNHEACPEIKNNTASTKGGAVYLSGNDNTFLDIYCLYEDNNMASDGETEHNFIMMEGGNCVISSAEKDAEGNFVEGTSGYGNVHITGTAYIIGGNMDIWGVMSNPSTKEYFTVNILADENGNIGRFVDHRPSEQEEVPEEEVIYKLHYYENFKGSGKYKAIDIPAGQTVTISGTIYSHPGYKIIGWYTNPDGTGTEYQVNALYDPSTFEADDENPFLIIYAKWEAHNYHVEFNANTPGGISYGGSMATMADLEFDRDYTLPVNEFTCVGYTFTEWNTEPDGSGKAFADGEVIKNLTDVKGETVVLYAQWDEHIEPDPAPDPEDPPVLHSYTYSVSGTTLVRTCICGIVNYATLSAKDTTYNGNAQYMAKVEYSSNDSSVTWEPELVYETEPINAGVYTAYVEAPDGTESKEATKASVYFTIKKADQPAPPAPEFVETREDGKSTFTITPVPAGHGATKYRLVYVAKGTEEQSDWTEETQILIPYSLTSYHVEAKYEGDENYNESEITPSEASVFYVGKAKVEVTAQNGITVNTVSGEETGTNGIDIVYAIAENYHKTDDFKAVVTNADDDQAIESVVITHNEGESKFNVGSIQETSYEYTIKIHVSGVAVSTSVKGFVTEGQVFGDIETDSASISRDSAFSAYFEIENFDSANYNQPALKFSPALPKDTTIILVDKTDGGKTYWCYRVSDGEGEGSVGLGVFTLMGGTEVFAGIATSAKYQFVVDFSGTENGCAEEELDVSLFIEKASDNSHISDVTCGKNVKLSDVTFEMTADVRGLSADLTLDFTKTYDASRWDGRRAALVLVPMPSANVLPEDARIEVVENNVTHIITTEYNMDKSGKFIMPIGLVDSKSVTITLKSDMFPSEAMEYSFACGWAVSDTMAGSAPMCGDAVDGVTITLNKEKASMPSIKVESADGGKTLYRLGETIKVDVDFEDIGSDLEVRATMMFRDNETGIYESFGLTRKVLTPGIVSMPLSADTPGSYSILIEVEDTKGYTIMQTPYYFIIQR